MISTGAASARSISSRAVSSCWEEVQEANPLLAVSKRKQKNARASVLSLEFVKEILALLNPAGLDKHGLIDNIVKYYFVDIFDR